MVLSIILGIIILTLKALWDKSEIKKGIWIVHAEIIIPAIVIIGLDFLILRNIRAVLASLDLFCGIGVIYFDLILNYLRGEAFDYVGTLTSKSSFTDRIWHKVGVFQYPIKICILLIAIYIYIKIKP